MNKTEFIDLFKRLTEEEDENFSGEEQLSDIAAWDSVAVVAFIAAVDEQFDMTLSPKAIVECTKINDLMGLLGDRIAA